MVLLFIAINLFGGKYGISLSLFLKNFKKSYLVFDFALNTKGVLYVGSFLPPAGQLWFLGQGCHLSLCQIHYRFTSTCVMFFEDGSMVVSNMWLFCESNIICFFQCLKVSSYARFSIIPFHQHVCCCYIPWIESTNNL